MMGNHIIAEITHSMNFMEWFGNYHLVFLHFPIALFLMSGISELLFLFTKNSRYEFTTKFLLISGILFCIPTVFSGLALEESSHFSQENINVLWLHKAFGLTTLILSLVTILIYIYAGRHFFYYVCLILLIISVILTAYYGGILAFGESNWLPSFQT